MTDHPGIEHAVFKRIIRESAVPPTDADNLQILNQVRSQIASGVCLKINDELGPNRFSNISRVLNTHIKEQV